MTDPIAEKIIEAVGRIYGFSPATLKAKTRKAEVVHARHIAMRLCCQYTHLSIKSVGEVFGGRDHSTVIHARDKINGLIDTYPHIRAEVANVERAVMDSSSMSYAMARNRASRFGAWT